MSGPSEHRVHEHEVQLRWGDADAYGHVNHARALGPLEDARLAMAQGSPGTVAGREPDIILARLEVDYLRQLRYRVGERLCVRTRVLRLGTKSFTVRQELTQDGEVAIRADAVMVLFDFATDASRPLTEAERAYWSGFQA
ncbi:acyl-CoA thioesterase [Blastococcus sp. TF02A-26]|nr:acyl-CoA thioesterase [Blastococcus sp. TF02A-26]